MLRRLIEPFFDSDDPQGIYTRNRQLRDLVARLGPLPATIRTQWDAADHFVDSEGNALSMEEHDKEVYGPGDFEYGDIWYQARWRKPLDMSDSDLELFVDLMKKMMRFEPELRPSTTELLQHNWFKDM